MEDNILGLTCSRIDLQNRLIRFRVQQGRIWKPKTAQVNIVDGFFEFLIRQSKRLRKASEDDHAFSKWCSRWLSHYDREDLKQASNPEC